MKFKSKSEVIEAVQWQGYTPEAEEKLLAWGIRPETMSFHADNRLEFRTSTGSTYASCGDWIVRSSSGEFYSCHQKAFEAIYEPVLDDPAPRSFAPGQIAGMSISFPHDLLSRIGVCLLLAALLVPNLLWIMRDRRVWPWDQAWYGEVSVDLWYFLRSSPTQWFHTMMTGMNMKPPGIVWIGQLFVPLQAFLGSIESALLFSVLVVQFCQLVVIYRIGRALYPNSFAASIAGVLFASATQAFVALSHQYFVEPLQALSVSWMLLVAVNCREWPRARTLIHLFAALVLSALAKASTPAYSFVFYVYIASNLMRRTVPCEWRQEIRRPASLVLLSCSVLAAGFAALWYAINLHAVWQHVREASSGEIALQYGFSASVGSKLITWLKLVRQCFLAPYLDWVFLIGLAIAVTNSVVRRSRNLGPVAVPVLAILQIIVVLLLFASNDTVNAPYLYPILGYIVVLFMGVCAHIGFRPVVALLCMACIAQWILVQRVALGAMPGLSNQFSWLLPFNPDTSDYDGLTRVVELTSTSSGGYNIIAVEEPWFNANSAAFFAAKNRLTTDVRSYYTSLGYAQRDLAAGLSRIDSLSVRYVITLDEPFQSRPPNFVNVVSLPTLIELKRQPRFRKVPFKDSRILVFQCRE